MKKITIKQKSNISFGGGNITFEFEEDKPIKDILKILIEELNDWNDLSLDRIQSINIK